MLNRLFIAFCIVVCALSSCTNNDVYLQYCDIAAEGWQRDSICAFDVPIEDNTVNYNVYINVRHTPNYSNQNLWLFLKIICPDNTVISDTINFYLADERGKWLGTGVGNSYTMPVFYLQNEQFSQRGIYRFEIQQGMRYDALRGISNVGLRIEKIIIK